MNQRRLSEKLTWADLVAVEPRLRGVEQRALCYHASYSEKSPDWMQYHRLKTFLQPLVGWFAENTRIADSRSWNVAIKHIVNVWETGKAQ